MSTLTRFKSQSRIDWGRNKTQTDGVNSHEDITLGSVMRQADALERIAAAAESMARQFVLVTTENHKLQNKVKRLESKLRKAEAA
jgi:hypothetical protein